MRSCNTPPSRFVLLLAWLRPAAAQEAPCDGADGSPDDSLCPSTSHCVFGFGGSTCRDLDECALTFELGQQPWTDYAAADAAGRRRAQAASGEAGGGGTGAAEVVGVCDRLTVCTDQSPGFECSPCPAGHVGSGASGCCNDDGTVDCSGATEAAAATGCSVGDAEACLNGGVCAPNALGENVCNCPVHFEGARCEVDKCASQVSGTHAGLIVGQDLCSGAGCHAYLGCWLAGEEKWFSVESDGLGGNLSPTTCISYCSILGYTFAGMKQDKCQCGNEYGQYGLAPDIAACDTKCPGGGSPSDWQICGGASAVSMYQTSCDGEQRLSLQNLISVFQKLDDNGDDKLSMQEVNDLYDGKDNQALLLPDCASAEMPDYWLGDGVCDDGSAGRADFNCPLYACDRGDCGATC